MKKSRERLNSTGRAAARLLPALLLATLFQAGCATQAIYRQAQEAEQAGDWDEAVVKYMEAVRENPDNIAYRAALMRSKVQAAQDHVRRGKQFREAGVLERAMFEYRQAVELDPSNQYAEAELRRVVQEVKALKEGEERARSIAELKQGVRGARAQPPVLNPRSNKPIDLIFSKPVSVVDIYRALGKAFGINVLFDPKLKDTEIAIELNEVVAQDALEILMRTVGHFYKVLDETSIIIADDTPQNRRNYEDQVIQTFFLDNAEVKDVMTMVRSLIGAKHVAANEQLNAIVLRDTADKVKVAEQIILANDKAKAEVVVDVELLQINTSSLQDLGMRLTSNTIGLNLDLGSTGTGDGASAVPLRISDLQYLNQNNWTLTVPSFAFDFLKNAGEAQTLARPKLRITEGEKASLVIGDRVPIPTTTFNTANQVGQGVLPVTSFQYQDVGIKIDIEPRVHHNEEVTLKLKVEVSNIADFVSGSDGQEQPVIGTRNIETNIRLRDGETNFLAGLIRTDETRSESGVPGLSDLPILGRLFTHYSNDNRRTDIVLTLTPNVIRRASIEEEDLLPIWVGTETNITFRGGSPRVESNVSGPFDDDARSNVRERLRERLRSLPRGLQDAGEEPVQPGEEPPPQEAPQGIDLVPSGGLQNSFSGGEEGPDET
ncbi:MAG: secretin N-terminal domain-containing protein [Acidobacteriota bacterium]